MKVVAIADLHGRLPAIQPCDVLILAGDICPEPMFGVGLYDPELQRVEQSRWLADEYYDWETAVPATNIFATPGNHDWIVRMPSACRTELFIDEGRELNGKRFWFTPWTNIIGPWNYQLDRTSRKGRFADIPTGLDVLVSHSPAYDVLDLAYGNEHAGCPELRAAIQAKRPKHVVFGHIHEGQRAGQIARLGPTTMHHVSLWNYDTGMSVKRINPAWKAHEFEI